MTALVNGSTKRYSWWWDSHISPKNSKWLQENLTDMDRNVKQMIKVIEEDADSFARRAEMYYKKRPELMKLVEEFYRAYRALAERYDHATGVIRQAQQTMAEAFPNQDPMMFGEEVPIGSSANEFDPQTPESYPPIRAPVYPNDSPKDAFSHMSTVKRNIAFMEDGKGLKVAKARKGLNFNDGDEKGRNAKVVSESERASKAEAEIVALKDALSKVQAEKEAKIAQFEQNLERLSNLESEVSRAQEDSKGLTERATRAEAEVETLRESLSKLDVEKESSLVQYEQCLQNIADLEDRISQSQKEAGEENERASRAEAETVALKESLARSENEKEAALVQYQQCLETICDLEERLRKAEEDAMLVTQRAENAEGEVESLKQRVSNLIEENDVYELQYQQCLDTIADLKLKLFHAQEETQRLSREIEDGVAKLKTAEEQCVVLERSNQNLHSELDDLLEKFGSQSHELTEKQKEVGRLWTCVQEENSRFMEAETAFQTLQQLHSQSQEELSTLELELQNRSQILKDMETRNNVLQEAVHEAKDENESLSERNLASAAFIKSLQEEVSRLRETIQKLEAEVELRVDQRNALQQEIYCLKEELSQIGKKHQSMVKQVELVGLHPEGFGSSVKELQDENVNLKEIKERESIEKKALLEKLEMMEKLVQKNLLLENSISDLNSELETVRGKLKTLEESCLSLAEEKSGLRLEKVVLIARLQSVTEDSQKLSEENRVLENSLSDANAELEELKAKLTSLEDSYHLLNDDKSSLVNERESLLSRMDLMRKRIEDLEKEQAELKVKSLELETERESSLQKIDELGKSLDAKDREYASFMQLSKSQMNGMESKIHHLQDENQCREREYQAELDRAHDAHIEIIVLQKCIQDWLEKSSTLIAENQKIKEASKLLEKLVSELEQENNGKQVQIESSINCIKILRTGIYQILMKLEIIPGIDSADENSRDQKNMHDILSKLDEMQTMLLKIWDENQQSVIENLVLVEFLRELKSEAVGIATQKKTLEEELESRCQQLSFSQEETQKLICLNGELTTKVNQGVNREEVLKVEIADLHTQVLQSRDDYSILKEENDKTLEEKTHLTKSTLRLEEEKRELEEDISLLLSETIYQSSLILVLEDVLSEKLSGAMKLNEDLERLSFVKCKLKEESREVGDKLKSAESENLELEGLLEKSGSELLSAKSANDQLEREIANVKGQLGEKEREVLEAMLVISVVRNEKSELLKTVEDIECRYKEAKAIEEDKDNQVLKLRGDFDEQVKKNDQANEANLKLEAKLMNLLMELEEIKVEKERLNHELVKERSEVELWESQAATLYGDLQISAVHETLLHGLTHELADACKNLENRSTSKDVEIDQLKGRVNNLEGVNEADSMKHLMEVKEIKAEREKLNHELVKERSEAELWESQAARLYGDLQISAVQETLLHGLTHELAEACKNLENRSTTKDAEIDQLKGRVNNLEGVNEANLMNHLTEVKEIKAEREKLNHELAKERSESELWESQAAKLYEDLQISAVRETLLHGLTHGLGEACENLEKRSTFKDVEIDQLKGQVNNLEADLMNRLTELKEIKAEKEKLNHELVKERSESELWESQAATLFEDLQISAVNETLLDGLTHELAEACKNLEKRSTLKDVEINQLKGRVNNLEANLMNRLTELKKINTEKEKLNHELVKERSESELWESQAATLFEDLQISAVHETLLDGLTHELTEACKNLEERSTSQDVDINQLKGRVHNLEGVNKGQNELMSKYAQAIFLLKESLESLEKHFAMPYENEPVKDISSVADNNDGFSELQEMCWRIKAIEEAVTKKLAMEALKNSSARRSRRRSGSLRKPNHEIFYADETEMITKDIVLDQVSDCSSYGISKRDNDKPQHLQKGKTLSEESLVVDKLEISDRFTDPNKEVNKRKVLERLHSDLQKLSTIHTAVEDLKCKVEKEEKGDKGKEDEYETIKGQINEAEEALETLLSVNRKLVTKVQSGFEKTDGSKSSMDLDENESTRRRRISEQARRGSEKIGRLQLEIQRLQNLLMKLEGEREDRAKVKTDSKTRILLRDYIYSGVRGERRKRMKKRFAFCGCVQPPPSP